MAKRILIVDDEPRYLRLLEANLRTEGYEVVTAQDGLQAVGVFSDQPIDLVLMDVMMPKLDGFGATQRIREFSSTPIIILTAKGDEQDRVRGLDLGADDYLVKPFSATELLARELGADLYVMLTDADAVYVDWGKPTQKSIRRASPGSVTVS